MVGLPVNGHTGLWKGNVDAWGMETCFGDQKWPKSALDHNWEWLVKQSK